MKHRDLSVIIPAREEMFLSKTIDCVLENIEADTEVIAVLDGYWPEPPVIDNDRVVIIHHTEPVGQRAATNDGARLSQAKYVMKLDAHCAVDKGFDRKLMDGCQPDWTLVPTMWNLHAFDWKCNACGDRTYQGPLPEVCGKCKESKGFERVMVWKPRDGRVTHSWRFDNEMHFQYWHKHRHRKETRRGAYIETMSFIGACWFMERDRYWELDGLDEAHGIWGQVGTEVACKSWLSGGKLLTAKSTWFAHMFRIRNIGFGFPYPISGNAQERARKYSRDLWTNNRWPKQKHNLEWLVEKFKPVPGWHDEQGNLLTEPVSVIEDRKKKEKEAAAAAAVAGNNTQEVQAHG
jgi:glycosyltransferase involved in cell wall biosynthesis